MPDPAVETQRLTIIAPGTGIVTSGHFGLPDSEVSTCFRLTHFRDRELPEWTSVNLLTGNVIASGIRGADHSQRFHLFQ